MTNFLDTSSLTDTLSAFDVPSVNIDLPNITDVGDALTDAGEAITASAAVAGRRTSRLARSTVRLGARGGSAGARAAFRGTKATGRAIGRGSAGTVRVARQHPKASLGILVALIALLAGYTAARRKSATDSDVHLAAVA